MPSLKTIKRTVYASACYGQRINEQGEFEDFFDTILDRVSPRQATVIMQNKYNDRTIVVFKVETEAETLYLTPDQFLLHAVPESEYKKDVTSKKDKQE